MKRVICIILLFASIFSLTACGCDHSWNDATCTSPKTCSLCGETEGDSLSHNWVEATCISPKKCTFCNATEGNASSVHNYVDDKCINCNSIQLTLSNYEDYIDINATIKAGDSIYSGSTYGYLYTSVKCSFEAIGNPHFKYDDVYITIKFSHYDSDNYLSHLFYIANGGTTEDGIAYDEAENTIALNLAGNGSSNCTLYTPWSSDRSTYSDLNTIFRHTTYTVLSVSGTIQEY